MPKKIEPKRDSGKDTRRRRTQSIRTIDEEQLWKNVLRQCEAQFEATFGRPWLPGLRGLGKADNELEKEARDVYARLRYALDEAIEFARRPDVAGHHWPGQATRIMQEWVPKAIEPVRRMTWLSPPPPHKSLWSPIMDPRSVLVHTLDRYNLFGIQRPDGGARFLTVREMAIVSLLAGNRPKLRDGALNYTIAEIIKREANNIRPLVKKHGMRSVTDEERGGPAVPAPAGEPVEIRFTIDYSTNPPQISGGVNFTS